MDVSITNRLPGTIAEVEYLKAPYARVTFRLSASHLHALVTWESVDRLALRTGMRAWVMLKTVAISELKLDARDPKNAPTAPSLVARALSSKAESLKGFPKAANTDSLPLS